MKKNLMDNTVCRIRQGRKLLRIMKITTFLLLVNLIMVNATNSYSQKALITIKTNNVSVEDALEQIREISDYNIFYSTDELDENQKVDLLFEDEPVEEILDHVLQNQKVGYVIVDDKIIISRKKYVEETQQPQEKLIHLKGHVTDVNGSPVPGVNVFVKDTYIGAITDMDGNYRLDVPPTATHIVFSFIGMKTQEVRFNKQTTINIAMADDSEALEEVAVVAFGKQKKESVLASIETIDTKEIKVPSSNLTTALAGRMAGIISYQRSGEPGQDNASFFIRGVTTFGYSADPLILIDNIESSANDLARLQPDDVASFSIMKDATAAALYGARGANGVILVSTKEGTEGKAKVSIRLENSISGPTDEIELADPITYMKLHNEAVRTRNPLGKLPYTREKIAYTEAGVNPYVYPQTDWHDELFKNYAINQRLNFNVSGGGRVARYYLAATANKDNGILNVDDRNNFNNNIDLRRYNVRSNLNINITSSTEVALKITGSFDDYEGPIPGGSGLYKMTMKANPVLFPAYFPPDEANKHKQFILFGNHVDEGKLYFNPYAELVKGYKNYSNTNISAQFELKQDFDWLIKGLKARLLGSTTRYSAFDVKRYYNPFYYEVGRNDYDIATDTYTLTPLNTYTGTEYLEYKEGEKKISTSNYMETAVNFNRQLNDVHNISAMLIYTMRSRLMANAGSLQTSLPYRNMGLSGRFTYSYNSRYFTEFNFGYNGSERFHESQRFGFFPSAGLGWIVSNENFWGDGIKQHISKLKLKATYGLTGMDAIGAAADRFFYLAEVDMDSGTGGATFGKYFSEHEDGITMERYPNPDVTWETSTKTNLGIEMTLWDMIDINADYFKEHRENILMDRLMVASMGLQTGIRANVGATRNEGIDMSIDINKYITPDWWVQGRANFTFNQSEFEKYEEPDYSETPWRSKVGQPLGQTWGYIAERLFIDEADLYNSPDQSALGEYMAGDIKYRDINGDDKITEFDKVPIGYPTTPQMIYGFGISTGYKGIDISCFFQGSGKSSFWIDPSATAPFVPTTINSGGSGEKLNGNNALLQIYADNHWSEDNRNPYALWPRLDYRANSNNTQKSTWFMQDGSFLRLKSLEVGYTLPKQLTNRFKVTNLRVYYSGTNLALWSNFDLWDVEMGGNGLAYPLQRVHNLGVQVSF